MSRKPIVLCAVVFLTFATVIGLSAVYLTLIPKQYQAISVVAIPPTSNMATEIEIIKGQNLAERVMEQLDYRGAKLGKKERNSGRDLRISVSKLRNRLKLEFRDRLRDRLKVKRPGSSDLIEISEHLSEHLIEIAATGDSPREAKDIANCLAAEYVQLSFWPRHKLWEGQRVWDDLIKRMEGELEQTRADLEKSGELLNEYMIFGVPQAVAGLKAGIVQMEVELDILRESLPESDPQIIDLKSCIAVNRQKLPQEEKKAIEKYSKQFGLSEVSAEAVFKQQLYTSLAANQERLKDQDVRPNMPMIIDVAEEPLLPIRPRTKLVLLLSGVLGLSLSLGLALFLSRRL